MAQATSKRKRTHDGAVEIQPHPDQDKVTVRELFRRFSSKSASAVGSPWAFILAVTLVVGWAFTKPLFQNADTWQLVINTSTTIVTFLMVFLIQNTQNRDSRAIQIKLDELLRAITGARTNLVDLEDATDEELEHLQKEFEKLRKDCPKDDRSGDSCSDEQSSTQSSTAHKN